MNPSKGALYEMLGNAARNTVAIGEGRKPVPDSPAKACPENAATNLPAAEGMERAASRLAGGRTPEGEVANRPPRSIAITKPGPKPKPVVTAKMPTADDVARAIVAAAREAEEIDQVVADLDSQNMLRCRHYAMHALVHCFPRHPRAMYARLVGCPGKPDKFFDNSKMWVIGTGGRRRSKWWNEAAYARVIAAIEGAHG